jgi:hypothetical protein
MEPRFLSILLNNGGYIVLEYWSHFFFKTITRILIIITIIINISLMILNITTIIAIIHSYISIISFITVPQYGTLFDPYINGADNSRRWDLFWLLTHCDFFFVLGECVAAKISKIELGTFCKKFTYMLLLLAVMLGILVVIEVVWLVIFVVVVSEI